MRIERLAAAHLEAFRALFEAVGSGCYCRFWHFTGNKNEWLDRCAHRPHENLEEQARAVESADPSGEGLVALDDTLPEEARVVGWVKLAPRVAVPKLTSLPVYRAIPPEAGAEDATWTIGCFLVHPAARKRGVARALALGAEAHARARGGRVLEAHPRRPVHGEPLYDEEVWQGPEKLFRDLGYVEVRSHQPEAGGGASSGPFPYPLYRKALVHPTT